ncbi:hypothetical protein [Domibacillus indicus]|uniref:hypothetical protein n=1 Tax=Domibacillus indicus TaxID=1437523 RepID=UPI000617E400|nr:hypothetical protein [Domibacillus indicus]
MNLMKLEMMNATDRVGEALQTRGLFVKTHGGVLTLTKENTDNDIKKVRFLLEKLNIPTLWKSSYSFEVLINQLPISIMKKIMHEKGKSFPIRMEGYHFKWRSFAQRRFGIKVNALDLDANMAMFVKSLNLAGVTTLAGCSGHHRFSPKVQLSGIYQGMWFTVIQQRYFNELSLHYKWDTYFATETGAAIVAKKAVGESWDMDFIYQDTVQMACVLQQHAEEIRELKKTCFKRNKEMKQHVEKMVNEKKYNELLEWMSEEVNKERE